MIVPVAYTKKIGREGMTLGCLRTCKIAGTAAEILKSCLLIAVDFKIDVRLSEVSQLCPNACRASND